MKNVKKKAMIMSCDGSFCNKTCMAINDPRIIMVARCRKDAKLCRPSTSKRKIYGDTNFTPEEIRQDENIHWVKKTFFYGGQWREIRYKETSNVLWENGTKRTSLRLVVLAPLPYVRGGKRNYCDPVYLLATSREVPIEIYTKKFKKRQ